MSPHRCTSIAALVAAWDSTAASAGFCRDGRRDQGRLKLTDQNLLAAKHLLKSKHRRPVVCVLILNYFQASLFRGRPPILCLHCAARGRHSAYWRSKKARILLFTLDAFSPERPRCLCRQCGRCFAGATLRMPACLRNVQVGILEQKLSAAHHCSCPWS